MQYAGVIFKVRDFVYLMLLGHPVSPDSDGGNPENIRVTQELKGQDSTTADSKSEQGYKCQPSQNYFGPPGTLPGNIRCSIGSIA
jgi:hypothetical protein